MLYQNILIIGVAFASVASAAPAVIQERSTAKLEVFTNGTSAMVTPLDPATVTA